MLAIIFCHHASIGGIPCGSDEEVFETGVVLKKSNDNCKSHEGDMPDMLECWENPF